MTAPEPWLRGPVAGVTAGLQPVAHELLFATEELEQLLPVLSAEQVWRRPGNIAPIGYHVLHFTGSIDRMLTYVEGHSLSGEQFAALEFEKEDHPEMDGAALLNIWKSVFGRAMEAVRNTSEESLSEPRAVGRKKLPSTIRGLFSEIAVHTSRHVGQIATTVKLVR